MILTIPQLVLLLFAATAAGFAIGRSYQRALVQSLIAECVSFAVFTAIQNAALRRREAQAERDRLGIARQMLAWRFGRAQRAALTKRLEEAV